MTQNNTQYKNCVLYQSFIAEYSDWTALMSVDLEKATIPHRVARAASLYGDATAVEDEGRSWPFRELDQMRVRSAKAFLATGMKPGDRIALWAPNSAEWIFATIGLQSIGAILVPLNTRLKGKEAGYILRQSGARLLLTVSDFLGVNYPNLIADEDLPDLEQNVLLQGGGPDITWADFLEQGSNISDQAVADCLAQLSPDDLSDILFTSGTTGNPKGVMTTHGQTVEVFEVWSNTVGLRDGDRYLIVNPFFHSFGYKAGWLACVLRGATIIPHQVFDAGQVLKRVSAENISVLPGPPTLYQSILADPNFGQADLSSLRLAVTGAASIPVELIEHMKSKLGCETVLTAYGLTESCGVVSMCAQDDDAKTIATTSGKAIRGVELRCVDETNTEVERGTPGEIIFRGFNVMKGYFNDEAATRDTIDKDGWLHTGDIGIMDERGYIQITDRKKDMFITGGFNCYPAEIENILVAHDTIIQAAVIGVPDERMGEVAKAFIVCRDGETLDPDAVIAWCRDNMANYKVPRYVDCVDALPMNASGKVQKFLLK